MGKTRAAIGVRIAFETLGCRSNYADTVEIQAAALERGAVPTNFKSPADIYVLNTCTVTDAADREVHKLLRRARGLNPRARVVALGCLAEVKAEELLSQGLADAAFGSGTASELADLILGQEARKPPEGKVVETRSVEELCRTKNLSDALPGPGQALGELKMRARYALRVQQGCDNYCTFCIVPQTRGPCSSRPVSDILSDLKRLEQLGYHEVVLAGTNLGSYGSDLGGSFGGLLEAIERLSPAMRVRLSSLDPNELNHDIVDLIADSSLFCPHIHLSLQALSDRVLKRMNRKYSVDFVVALLERLQQRVSRAGIGADLIAGFPGESREEVDQAVELFLELPISYLHVFPYSEREGTAATRLDASVPVAERQERARRWREVSQAKRHEFYSSLVGSTLDVIVENELGAGRFSGTSAEYAPVSVSKQSDAAVVDSFKPGARVKLKAERFVASEGRIECV